MSAGDPLSVLAGFDRPVEPRREFADALLASCLLELQPTSDFQQASARRRRPARTSFRVGIAVAVTLLVLAGVATATYFALRTTAAGVPPSGAGLTVIVGSGRIGPSAKIAVVGPNGALRFVWKCPEPVFCGELTSIAWAPNGKRLALTLDEIGGNSGYVGLHILDLRNGHDLHIPSLPIPPVRSNPGSCGRSSRKRDDALAATHRSSLPGLPTARGSPTSASRRGRSKRSGRRSTSFGQTGRAARGFP